jgi:uncharacterized protein
MSEQHIKLISVELHIGEKQVANTMELLEGGATVPFISRYRKEATGSLDEVAVLAIKNLSEKYTEIDKRRETILSTIEEQGKLTPELKAKITSTWDMAVLEDLYLPYKPKRKTRASVAREKGLEPLAEIILKQTERDITGKAESFINENVPDAESALEGARDIIAEIISEDARARNSTRNQFVRSAQMSSKLVKGKEEDAQKYRDYFEFSEPLKRCPSHRYLAMRRGEEEGFLRLSIEPDEEESIECLERLYVKSTNESGKQVKLAVKDAYKRLLQPSLETEFRNMHKEKADSEAIKVFAENLRQLLLASPLGPKRVLGIDPGFRTGCKVVCLDNQGNIQHNETIYPHPPQNEYSQSIRKISQLCEMYNIEAVAIGNGTASRETESLIKKVSFPHEVKVFVVSEAGASVYSASEVAREEFPQYDVTVRGAISIGRRLMDPLAELVKTDPKSIGVGQYQHDVDQKNLQKSLDSVVESCVNLVGVNVNTASRHLLTYISGLGPTLAKNIVEYRRENGPFHSRKELLKVPKMGAKTFEQAAGFIRIPESDNPLDNTAVHPESYKVVEMMAKDLKVSVKDLTGTSTVRETIDLKKYVSEKVGLPTLTDIMSELAKPGRDPRSTIHVFEFADVHEIKDLQVGMELPGIVTNITNFGAFVDVGVHQDGLVHISQLADKFVSDPNEVIKLHQHVKVRVLEVDAARKRIAFTMKGVNQK